jgi:hypothetical protein
VSWTRERAKVAALSRCVATGERPADDPELLEARRNMRALRLEEHVQKVIAEAPPLTAEQRDHIAAILRGGGGAPPGLIAAAQSGVATSPSKSESIEAARIAELDSGGDHAA